VTKKHSILRVIFGLLLIISPTVFGYAQIDTTYIEDDSFDTPIKYSARDSLYTDLKNEQIHLFGDAKVSDGEITMNAGYILVDLKKNEVLATFIYDSDSNRVEMPTFSDGTENITAASIRYNFDTEKGYIEELTIRQDETYMFMGIAKRHPNDEIHFKNGRFTTCELDEPHYHFQLSKAIMIPDERIVTGPVNLHVKGVPTPIGFPFSVIPQQKERTHGILFPELVPISQYGFGVQNLGYYIPINDRLQTSPYITLLSRGSWGVRNNLNYSKRYGYNGALDLGFQQFRLGFPSNSPSNKISITWVHRQEQRANPYWNFSSNVNFISDNQSKNNLDPLNPDYFNNSFNSDINLNRAFPGKPLNMGLKMSVRQNSLTKNVSLLSPIYNLNMSRVFPFKKLIKGTESWKQIISRLGVTYSLEGQNRSTFTDTLLKTGDFTAIGDQFMNGLNQQLNIQTTAGFYKGAFKLTPSFSYGNKINFQQVTKSYDALNDEIITDTVQKGGMTHELSVNAQLTTVVYSYYKFIGKKKPILRHILTPSVGIRYTPQLNKLDTLVTTPGNNPIVYSPFERSVYAGYGSKSTSLLTFGINNTFELKRKSDKDTITGFRKTRLIDALSLTGAYDFTKDSMNLSDLSLNLRISPVEWLNIVASSTFSPYDWVDSTGKTLSAYAFSNDRFGRFMRNDITTTLTLTSQESRKRLNDTEDAISKNWNADFNYYNLHPEYLIDFEIPWKLSFSHVYSIFANTNKTVENNLDYEQLQTLVLNGDVSFTKRWKLSGIINLDLQQREITNARLSLSRNMHCWALSFNWTPIGGNKSFLLSIRNTSSIFQDAKFDIRKPPVFL
jgi:hypothetical protein